MRSAVNNWYDKNLLTGNAIAAGLHKNILFSLLVLFVCSCSKEKQLDRDLLSLNGGGTTSFVQTGNLVYLNGNGYSLDRNFMGMPIMLSQSAGSQDTVTATIDPSLVATYNSLHNERNPVVPVGAFTVSNNGKFPVAAGESQLKDSLHVTLVNGTVLVDRTVYLVPVRLSTKGNAKLSSEVVYIKYFFTIAQLNARIQGISRFPYMTIGVVPGGMMNVFCTNTCPDQLKFRVSLNTIFPVHETDVEAALMTDAEVDAIMTANRYFGVRMSRQVYALTKNLVKVPVTSMLSRDSLVVSYPNKALLVSGSYNFMGLKLIQHTGSDYGVAPLAADTAKVLVRILVQ
ncbi:DUF1735 domain-containing protein [Pedobacter sp. MC2016-14]|uniref:DUF1735 domain-containing protein n=1 Tax=Pedobacter sp. MC2016-14 TaxID=2897327 RepID=UPI001E30C8AC|nr:DUF1735 domain-containing protein [Pedobacter sp. MC2016-14]MCD0487802.1 DUF1735 domain-containing protein [Pedobacter sp. MC2016-14]